MRKELAVFILKRLTEIRREMEKIDFTDLSADEIKAYNEIVDLDILVTPSAHAE